MTRLQVFVWTVLACLASMLSVCVVAVALLARSSFGFLLMDAWFLAFFSGFLVLYLGGGIGFLLGLIAMLQKKLARNLWGRQARTIALWGNPVGMVFGIIRILLRIPARRGV